MRYSDNKSIVDYGSSVDTLSILNNNDNDKPFFMWDEVPLRFVKHPYGKFDFGIVALDLAQVLYSPDQELQTDGHRFTRSVDDRWKGLLRLHTEKGDRNFTILWEPGIYKVLSVSRKREVSKRFEIWLFEHLIPNLRRKGVNTVQPSNSEVTQLLLRNLNLFTVQTEAVESCNERLAAIESRLNNANALLDSLPKPASDPKQLTTRKALNQLVTAYASYYGKDYRETWLSLYAQYRHIYGVNLVLRADKAKESPIQYAENKDMLDTLYAVAYKMFTTQS